jgi:hypothetical protein
MPYRAPRPAVLVRSVLVMLYITSKHALALTAILGFFHTASLLYDLLFA